MNYPMQPIIQHLFQTTSLENVSRQRLESFVAEYPSFGIGHYLLSRKLQAEGADSYMEETQKTNLYFTNPFWLQLLLESPQDGGAQVSTPESIPSAVITPESIAAGTEPETFTSTIEPALAVSSIEPVKDTMDNVVEGSLLAASETANPISETTTAFSETVSPYAEDEAHPQSMVSLAEAVAAEEEPTAAEQLLKSIREAKDLRESLQKMNEDLSPSQPSSAAEEQTAPAIPEEQAQPIKDEEAPFVLDEDVMPVAETPSIPHSAEVHTAPEQVTTETAAIAPGSTAPDPAIAEPFQPSSIATTLAAASITFSTPIAKAEQTFVFEPYHTIDYFASQGIKLTLEENPSDQLGKQLKSFTDWLKVMRKLPQKEREIVPDRAAEQTVQTIAAHSVVGREIVTETMAEVLAKQGMPERARAVYEKLSLLNPDKRAYFATKIEQLNSL